ncbi:MAG: hypothetical protein JRD47_11635 [Deltaproteobacteria bacterium]|nr:hypothetical protein [Deltaproteobacteria bacterium]
MECPNCQFELPSRQCPECSEEIPVFGKFCCYCGASLPEESSEKKGAEEHVDFSSRVLCSDGNCIGVINAQGVCRECGKPYTGEA